LFQELRDTSAINCSNDLTDASITLLRESNVDSKPL